VLLALINLKNRHLGENKMNTRLAPNLRHDSPYKMNLFYQEQAYGLVETLDSLKALNNDKLDKVFEIIWPHVKSIIPELSIGAIISIKNNKLTCAASDKPLFISMINDRDIKVTDDQIRDDEINIWNYDKKASEVLETPNLENQAITLSRLWELSDYNNKYNDQKLYFILTRSKKERPFLSYEVQAIKLLSGMIGWFISYQFYKKEKTA
jgi:hypothetical protein